MTRRAWLVAVTAFSLWGPPAAGAQDAPAPRKRVAIMNFEYGTVQSWWGPATWDIGKGISDLVVTNLVKDGTFSVVERKMIDDILKEQNFSNSNRVDPKTAAKIGSILGVNAIIVGSVTQFGFEDKNFKLGGAGGGLAGAAIGAFGRKSTKATVVVDARIVDTTTAEILGVASGTGESSRGSFTGFGGAAGKGGFGAGGIEMGSSNFQNTIIGEATRKCVEALSVELVKSAPKVTFTKIEFAGRIADVDNATLVLNIGKDQGVRLGDVLKVERVVREVKDPDSGKVIRQVSETLGTLKITEVDATSSVGTFSGATAPKVGDRVKSQ